MNGVVARTGRNFMFVELDPCDVPFDGVRGSSVFVHLGPTQGKVFGVGTRVVVVVEDVEKGPKATWLQLACQ